MYNNIQFTYDGSVGIPVVPPLLEDVSPKVGDLTHPMWFPETPYTDHPAGSKSWCDIARQTGAENLEYQLCQSMSRPAGPLVTRRSLLDSLREWLADLELHFHRQPAPTIRRIPPYTLHR